MNTESIEQQNASLLELTTQGFIATAPMRATTSTISHPPTSPSSWQLQTPTKLPPPPDTQSPPLQKPSKPDHTPPTIGQTGCL
ncbi:hypothetical protein G6F46_009826 [Rhizopus delemar]|nr:hypothetical protein G6F55_003401 [Rhizopus delemar]KAG1543128.1 hypothetical protein G6F51_006862 [Rhizopus arrhizus]KAG1502222.1 hypothetical protein G6F54_002500 [Rhizopus delemar]KAG1513108.1 hypothetical protein G6F53_004681 [Rhizopus delemar]KAG1521128.1 hypothetical protein G6F52_007020 [Rhizopus delemar]